MYLRTAEEAYLHRRWNTQQVRHHDVLSCDECGREYSLGHKASHATSFALTFCSPACNKQSRSSGKLAQQWKRTKLERYGVEHSSQVPGASKKMVATRIERTGASGPASRASTSNGRWRETMLQRHGAEMPSQSESVQAKKLETYRDRYGIDNPLSAGSPFRDPADAVKGGQAGYRALVLKHGSKVLSKPETDLHRWLVARYGDHDVEQQVPIEHRLENTRASHWLVDFYVRSIDTYIQMDGVFWHGLNAVRSALHPNARAVYDRDRVQDAWFAGNGKKLVRITDQLLNQCQRSDDYADIVAKLGG